MKTKKLLKMIEKKIEATEDITWCDPTEIGTYRWEMAFKEYTNWKETRSRIYQVLNEKKITICDDNTGIK